MNKFLKYTIKRAMVRVLFYFLLIVVLTVLESNNIINNKTVFITLTLAVLIAEIKSKLTDDKYYLGGGE